MIAEFSKVRVSVALTFSDRLPYDSSAFSKMVTAALDQDHPSVEVIVVDDRGDGAALPPEIGDGLKVTHVVGSFSNRAAMYNAALQRAQGDFFLALYNLEHQIVLRRSAVRTMVMAATRQHAPSVVYGDYELIDAAGKRKDVHLLDWHEGRLRDMADFGSAILYRADELRELGGWNESLSAADVYDLWLRMTERNGAAHIANRYAGSLYTMAAPATEHNVFDYLLASKETQLEMERVCTDHLGRIGAYLEPGAHVRKVEYTKEELHGFDKCVASVVIPVNNRPDFIGRAIESVQAQTVPNVEVIVVVNGGDSDPTCDAVRAYMAGGDKYAADKPGVQLIVVDINNLGVCLNSGLSAAHGKFYVQLDSDDRLKPDAVEKLLAVYDSDPTIGMVIGSYEVSVLNEETGEIRRDERVPVVTHDEWTADNGRNNLLRIGGAGAPRSAHIKAIADAGWFGVNDDPECRNYGEDYDLVLRISERYTIGRVWDPIYEVIRHSGGTDHSIDQVTIDRNDNAKDNMRSHALRRRRQLNKREA